MGCFILEVFWRNNLNLLPMKMSTTLELIICECHLRFFPYLRIWRLSRQGPALQELVLCKTMDLGGPHLGFPISITWKLIETLGLSTQPDGLKPWRQESSNPHFNGASIWPRHQPLITYSRKHWRLWGTSTEVEDTAQRGTVHITKKRKAPLACTPGWGTLYSPWDFRHWCNL